MLSNHAKRQIRAGKPQFGSLLNFTDPLVAEMMASVGFVAPGIHCAPAETVNRRTREGWPLVGMLNDQRFLVPAATSVRDAVTTSRE